MIHAKEYENPQDDYQTVRSVIELISQNWQEQPELGEIASAIGKTPTQLQKLFTRWAGLSPKAFLQAVTLVMQRDCWQKICHCWKQAMS